jgi:hypothetical protein
MLRDRRIAISEVHSTNVPTAAAPQNAAKAHPP